MNHLLPKKMAPGEVEELGSPPPTKSQVDGFTIGVRCLRSKKNVQNLAVLLICFPRTTTQGVYYMFVVGERINHWGNNPTR